MDFRPIRTPRLVASAITILLIVVAAARAIAADAGQPFKVLYVMSYHSPWAWTDEQLAGFRQALAGLDVEYMSFQLDTKRRSAEESIGQASAEARRLIETWKPDLLYTSDDTAQKYVAGNYVGTPLPIVFSGVNSDPGEYGFIGSPNVTGVLELEHFTQSLELLRRIRPGIRRIAVVLDSDPTWSGVVSRMKARLPEIGDVEVVAWDVVETFDQYKRKVDEYHRTADAIALLGIFNFKNDLGNDVPYLDVLKWTAENSTLPDFSFWRSRVLGGTLCAVTVSGFEQGLAAGRMARLILARKRKPSEIDMVPSLRGQPVVSLARARKLGIDIPSSVLLSSDVLTDFEWEAKE